MNEQDRSSLSEAGRARREAMLGELVGQMQRLHHRRRVQRTAAASACMVVLLIGLSLLAMPARRPGADSPPMVVAPKPAPGISIEIVRTDPSILQRFAVRTTSRAILLDDEALLDELVAMGRPAGLIRSGDRVWLTADVVDQPPAEDHMAPPPAPPRPSSL
jgi:hypothetical protein